MANPTLPLVTNNAYQWQWEAHDQNTITPTNPLGDQIDLNAATLVTFEIVDPTGITTTYPTTIGGSPGIATTGDIVFITAIVGVYTYSWKATIPDSNSVLQPYATVPIGFMVEESS